MKGLFGSQYSVIANHRVSSDSRTYIKSVSIRYGVDSFVLSNVLEVNKVFRIEIKEKIWHEKFKRSMVNKQIFHFQIIMWKYSDMKNI